MSNNAQEPIDLSGAIEMAERLALEWNLELGVPFAMNNVSFVAPTSDGLVLKVGWEGGEQESLHEPDALELWDGCGAVRALRRCGHAVLEERAIPGDDLSIVDEHEATAIAVDLAQLLWRPVQEPFRSVEPYVDVWLGYGEREGNELIGLARELLQEVGVHPQWVVHGDFHHHNILRRGDAYVAIDPKPFLADREYDVPSFLWNPMDNLMVDHEQTERRIAAFVASGLDDFKIRAWSVIRGSYLRPEGHFVEGLRALLA
ncbi:MAG: aminoglycoside phosphotransferase family protein [Acidimicrobiales bacterium]